MDKAMTTRVVLADDHDIVRQGLKRLLDRAPGIKVVGEASNGLQALQSVKELQPDVLLLDIEMPVMDGIEVARRIHSSQWTVRILVLSAYDDHEYIRALLDIGVSGYLVKGESPAKIIEAVRGVAVEKRWWISPQIHKKLVKMDHPLPAHKSLSYRDLEILRLYMAEKNENAIAQQLNLSAAEFAATVQGLLKKIEARSLEEAVRISLLAGWISASEID